MHHFYLNEELLLDSVAGGKVSFPKDKDMLRELGWNESVISELKNNIQILLEHVNKEIKNFKRLKKEPVGYHVPKGTGVSISLKEDLNTGKNNNKPLPGELIERIAISNLKKEDLIQSLDSSKKLDWLNFMIPDGKVFPYTIIGNHSFCKYGFPAGIYTKEGQDVDPASIKNVYYTNPINKKLIKGIYFEVSESAGEKGEGGINGIIAKEDIPTIIINNTRKEVYIIGAEKNLQNIKIPTLPTVSA